MRVFLSYASEDRPIAEQTASAFIVMDFSAASAQRRFALAIDLVIANSQSSYSVRSPEGMT